MTHSELQKALEIIGEECSDSPRLTLIAVRVLLVCMKHDVGLTGMDLLEKLDIPKSTLWRSMAYWTEYTEGGKRKGKGWLTRNEDELDGRAIVIYMTPLGRKMRDKILGNVRGIN